MSLMTLWFLLPFLSYIRSEIISCNGGACNCPTLPPTPGESCILDCGSEDVCKGQVLKCREGTACTVRCDDKNSCSDGAMINGFSATDLTVLCGGENGCKTNIEILCGTGECVLNCFGSTSCDEFGEIFTETAKGFTCNGLCPSSVPASFTARPTKSPSKSPSPAPTYNPTTAPTHSPTSSPSPAPTSNPTSAPTNSPTKPPTPAPSAQPTNAPTKAPTGSPTMDPTVDPTADPTADPSKMPTVDPTVDPTKDPTQIPTNYPSSDPTMGPTNYPSVPPTTSIPSTTPTAAPTMEPTTAEPSAAPTINTGIIMLSEDISILSHRENDKSAATTRILLLSIAVTGGVIALFLMIGCIKKRHENRYIAFKGSMVSVDPPSEVVEIIEGVTANSFYTITVHYGDSRFKYKLIGDIGNTGDTENCHWNASTYDNFIESIAAQFGLDWGGFALYEIVDGIHIDIEEMDDIIAGFDVDGGKEMVIYVKNGYKRKPHQRKITRSSIHLYHATPLGTPYAGAIIKREGSDSESYDIELPRPDSNDSVNLE